MGRGTSRGRRQQHRGKTGADHGGCARRRGPNLGSAAGAHKGVNRKGPLGHYPRLVDTLADAPRIAAFFDRNKTVIAKASMVAFSGAVARS